MEQSLIWIEHNGKKILHSDHARFGKNAENVVQSVERAVELVKESGEREIRLLEDMRNVFVVSKVLQAFKQGGKDMEPYTQKTAAIGLTGTRRVFLMIMNKVTTLMPQHFNTMDEALDWLTTD